MALSFSSPALPGCVHPPTFHVAMLLRLVGCCCLLSCRKACIFFCAIWRMRSVRGSARDSLWGGALLPRPSPAEGGPSMGDLPAGWLVGCSLSSVCRGKPGGEPPMGGSPSGVLVRCAALSLFVMASGESRLWAARPLPVACVGSLLRSGFAVGLRFTYPEAVWWLTPPCAKDR